LASESSNLATSFCFSERLILADSVRKSFIVLIVQLVCQFGLLI
jgi:hypothetical protein